MKRTVLLLAVVAGVSTLAGCVGFVPVAEPAPVAYPGPVVVAPPPAVVYRPAPPPVIYRHGPPPRAYRDRDGDGVPNRYDRRPNNPYRY